jgi:choline kinase
MKIIFLVAGSGSRLGSQSPKPLTLLSNGETLLGRQLSILSKCSFFEDTPITLVVGYKQEIYKQTYPDLLFTLNSKYESSNTAKSLLAGIGESEDEDVLWFNGDLFYDESIIHNVAGAISGGGNIVFYKSNRFLLDEEAMKLKVTRSSSETNVIAVSKDLRQSSLEAIGINFVKAGSLHDFKGVLESMPDDSYFESAINSAVQLNMIEFQAQSVGSGFITEIDFQSDLAEVEKYLKNNS